MSGNKWLIEFPIGIFCDLKCDYCFHTEAFELDKQGRLNEKYLTERPFSIQQYMAWRDKHLGNGEFLCDLHGGEMSHPNNQADVLNIIDTLDKEHFQLQTNGLGDQAFYAELVKRSGKIDRIGFTYHREKLRSNHLLTARYINNVEFLHKNGIHVYVKELFIKNNREEILVNKKYWTLRGIEFRIQDFKGVQRGKSFEEFEKYSPIDMALIHREYKHNGDTCYCRKGYKNVLIRGFDIFAGDVIACWSDPTVIGNIMEDWYKPNYTIARVNGDIDVQGVDKLYRGTYPKDTWSPENEKLYPNLTRDDINKKLK